MSAVVTSLLTTFYHLQRLRHFRHATDACAQPDFFVLCKTCDTVCWTLHDYSFSTPHSVYTVSVSQPFSINRAPQPLDNPNHWCLFPFCTPHIISSSRSFSALWLCICLSLHSTKILTPSPYVACRRALRATRAAKCNNQWSPVPCQHDSSSRKACTSVHSSPD